MIRIDGIIGEGPNTAEALAAELQGGAVEVVINSPGGDAFEGAAMLAELIDYPGKVTAHIRGIAASAASLIAMGADHIQIDASAMVMIHDPSGVSIGPAKVHREVANTLDKTSAVYADAYARRTGNQVSHIRQWMDDETWMNADEAVALNFADSVSRSSAEAVFAFDYRKFKSPPRDLVAIAMAQELAT